MTDFYLMGDSIGQWFGSGLWNHEGLRFDLVNFSTQWKNETSNRKKGTNLTVRVKELNEVKKLDNEEIFIFTDNQVFEGCFYKGHSNYRNLNGFMPRLQLAEMGTGWILHIIHVVGTRMNRAGIDGLS